MGEVPYLGGGSEQGNRGGRVHHEAEEAQHDVDDDSVDVGADEGGLQASSHRIQDDTDGYQHGCLQHRGTQHQACTHTSGVSPWQASYSSCSSYSGCLLRRHYEQMHKACDSQSTSQRSCRALTGVSHMPALTQAK